MTAQITQGTPSGILFYQELVTNYAIIATCNLERRWEIGGWLHANLKQQGLTINSIARQINAVPAHLYLCHNIYLACKRSDLRKADAHRMPLEVVKYLLSFYSGMQKKALREAIADKFDAIFKAAKGAFISFKDMLNWLGLDELTTVPHVKTVISFEHRALANLTTWRKHNGGAPKETIAQVMSHTQDLIEGLLVQLELLRKLVQPTAKGT